MKNPWHHVSAKCADSFIMSPKAPVKQSSIFDVDEEDTDEDGGGGG